MPYPVDGSGELVGGLERRRRRRLHEARREARRRLAEAEQQWQALEEQETQAAESESESESEAVRRGSHAGNAEAETAGDATPWEQLRARGMGGPGVDQQGYEEQVVGAVGQESRQGRSQQSHRKLAEGEGGRVSRDFWKQQRFMLALSYMWDSVCLYGEWTSFAV